ncbi:MAG: DUF58 domain-containing protein [Bacillus sp. (in: firmicutes)]
MKKFKALVAPYVKVVFILILIALAFIYAMFQGGFVSWFVFYSFLPFAVYPLLLSMYPLKRVEVVRRFHEEEYLAGDQMKVELLIKRKDFFPLLYIVVEDRIPDRFLQYVAHYPKGIVFPLFRREMKVTYLIPKAVRGDHHFTEIVMKSGDVLHLFEKTATIACHNHLLVYPNYRHMTFQQLDAVHEEGQQVQLARRNNDASLISGVRQYSPGDKQSWVHWKVSAKRNEMMTKEFEERQSQDILLVLDQSPSPLFEEMVSYIASLTDMLLQKRAGVAYAGTEQLQQPIAIGRGDRQLKRISYALATVEEAKSVSAAFNRRFIPANASCVFITSRMTKELVGMLQGARGNTAITLLIMKEHPEIGQKERAFQGESIIRGITCKYIYPNSSERGAGG